jgi:hypothetical protein
LAIRPQIIVAAKGLPMMTRRRSYLSRQHAKGGHCALPTSRNYAGYGKRDGVDCFR